MGYFSLLYLKHKKRGKPLFFWGQNLGIKQLDEKKIIFFLSKSNVYAKEGFTNKEELSIMTLCN